MWISRCVKPCGLIEQTFTPPLRSGLLAQGSHRVVEGFGKARLEAIARWTGILLDVGRLVEKNLELLCERRSHWRFCCHLQYIYIYMCVCMFICTYIPTGSLKTVGQNDILFFSLTSVRPLFVELLAMSRETWNGSSQPPLVHVARTTIFVCKLTSS